MELKDEAQIELSDDSLHNSKEVEHILDVKGRGPGSKYLIKWRGLDAGHNTWVTLERLEGKDDLLREFRSQRTKDNQLKMRKSFKMSDSGSDAFLKPSEFKSIENMARRTTRKQLAFDVGSEESNETDEESETKKELKQAEEEQDKKEAKQEDETPSVAKISLSNMSKPEAVQSKSPDKKKAAKAPNNVPSRQMDGLELFNLHKLTAVNRFVTSSSVTDEKHKEMIKKDIQGASAISYHCLIDAKLFFILKWNQDKTETFYRSHYFSFDEIEAHNPCILLTYLKDYLTYIIK